MPNTDTAALLDGIRAWVEMESHTADIEGVNRLMTVVAQQFVSVGADVQRIPGCDGRGDHLSVTSPWRGPHGENTSGILVLCHLDTVHPKGTLARDLPWRIEGDKAFGPGTSDMKGGAYLAYAAYCAIARDPKLQHLPIRLLYTSDEEVGSPTSRALIEAAAATAKYVLVTEAARDGGKIVTARKGVGRYEITTHGRAAHSGARHTDGRSAVVEMAHQILAIEAMTDYKRGVTLNIGQVAGGTADNVVPQTCTASIDLRVATMADAAVMHTQLMGLKPQGPDTTLTVSGAMNRQPYEETPAGRALFVHARKCAAEFDIDLVGIHTGGGSDGNFTAHTVATLDGLGCDGAMAHTLQEHLFISSLVPRKRLMQRLMETLR
jgi:glutamate carboxypeptidase